MKLAVISSAACHWIRRADEKPPTRRFWSKAIIGRSAFGIHTRPSFTAAETGNAGKRLSLPRLRALTLFCQKSRLSSWRKREKYLAFRMISLCGEVAVIDQSETSKPKTASMRAFDIVALKPKPRNHLGETPREAAAAPLYNRP